MYDVQLRGAHRRPWVLLTILAGLWLTGCETPERHTGPPDPAAIPPQPATPTAQPAPAAGLPEKTRVSPAPPPPPPQPLPAQPPPAQPAPAPSEPDKRPDAPRTTAPPPALPLAPVEASPDAAQETEPAPTPRFVHVLDAYTSGAPARVEAVVENPQRLLITSQNVRRIRIDRAAARLARERSVALILDGQGIEWTARSPVDEFERLESGIWRPVEPSRR